MRSDKVGDILQASATLAEETNRLLLFLNEYVDEQDQSFGFKPFIPWWSKRYELFKLPRTYEEWAKHQLPTAVCWAV